MESIHSTVATIPSVPLNRTVAPQRGARISGDILIATLEHSGLTAEQITAVRWLHDLQGKLGLNDEEIALNLRKPSGKPYSGHQVYMIYRGKHENRDVEGFCQAILAFKKLVEERAMVQRATFTETSLTKSMWQAFDAARIYQRVAFLLGPTQIGKTENALEYTHRNNHGKTIYVRMPEGGAIGQCLREMCRVLNLPEALPQNMARERILRCFRDDMLLIIDEAHQPFLCGERQSSYRIFEFAREIFDTSKCGLVFLATSKLREVITAGRYKAIFDQLKEREIVTVDLPEKPSDDDLVTFSDKYSLPPATGDALKLQTSILKYRSIGYWLTLLSAGSRKAFKAERPLQWDDVIQAHAVIESLNRGGARQ